MAVDIEVFGQLLPNQPRRRAVEIQEPATVRDLARAIGLDEDEIGLVTIDGVQSGLDDSCATRFQALLSSPTFPADSLLLK